MDMPRPTMHKSLWSTFTESPPVRRIRRIWNWLVDISTDDPLRYALNKGFAALLIVLIVVPLLFIPANILSGGDLSITLFTLLWLPVGPLMWWLNRRGTVYGAVLFILFLIVIIGVMVPASTYIGSEANASVMLLMVIPIISATLFVRPSAGLWAFLLLTSLLVATMLLSDLPRPLVIQFLVFTISNLISVTLLLVVGANIFVQALRTSFAANQALIIENRERQQAEAALRETEEGLRLLVNAALEAIALHKDGAVLEVNRAFCEMFGYDRDELIGMPVLDFMPPDQHGMVLAKIAAGETQPYESFGLRKDGATFHIEVVAKPITYLGRQVRMTAMLDLTQRDLAEAHRMALALANQQANMQKDFFNAVSHDFKSPLTTIAINASILEKITDPEMTQDRIDLIKSQVKRLEKLIEDILTVSRLETLPTLKFAPLDVNLTLLDLQASLQPLMDQKRLRVTHQLSTSLASIQADQDSFNRALSNLIENAVNYTPDQGAITFATRLHNDHVIIEISDTGIGISEADILHIFDSFYRAEQARKAHSGTGLGLAIVHKTITMHQGTIEVESRVGEGTTFRIRIPAALEPSDAG